MHSLCVACMATPPNLFLKMAALGEGRTRLRERVSSLNRVHRTLWWCQGSGGPTDGRGTVCVCCCHVTWQDSTCVAQRSMEKTRESTRQWGYYSNTRGLSRVPVSVWYMLGSSLGEIKWEWSRDPELCIGKQLKLASVGHMGWWVQCTSSRDRGQDAWPSQILVWPLTVRTISIFTIDCPWLQPLDCWS